MHIFIFIFLVFLCLSNKGVKALIYDFISWAWKAEVVYKGHSRLLEIIRANNLEGLCKCCWSVEWESLPMFDLIGSEFYTIFHSKCLSLCWSFVLQRQFPSVVSKGEVLAGWSWIQFMGWFWRKLARRRGSLNPAVRWRDENGFGRGKNFRID